MRSLNLDREKKGRKRCETGKQDVGTNTSGISEGRQKCLNCIFGLYLLLYKKTGVEEQLLIFPISYHDKSCSDIQQAETKGDVSTEKFAALLRSLRENLKIGKNKNCRRKVDRSNYKRWIRIGGLKFASPRWGWRELEGKAGSFKPTSYVPFTFRRSDRLTLLYYN